MIRPTCKDSNDNAKMRLSHFNVLSSYYYIDNENNHFYNIHNASHNNLNNYNFNNTGDNNTGRDTDDDTRKGPDGDRRQSRFCC